MMFFVSAGKVKSDMDLDLILFVEINIELTSYSVKYE